MEGVDRVESIINTSYKNNGTKLVNFNAPVELLDRFDQTVEKILGTRTQVLLHLMDVFTKIFEEKDQQVNIIKKA